jgi:hypothetical protein
MSISGLFPENALLLDPKGYYYQFFRNSRRLMDIGGHIENAGHAYEKHHGTILTGGNQTNGEPAVAGPFSHG